MKNIFISLILSVFLVACAPPANETSSNDTDANAAAIAELPTAGTTIIEEGRCNLGRKSGGITVATESECRDLGGRFLD